ncbi:FMN-dependent 2-nitropropane dioxygenase [Ilyonectria destructans]|nr:FMN-dependent 2-nitropropane dioxygenase [Ilyonectria destructans]
MVYAKEERSLLNAWFPHTENPVIVSGPMLGTSNGTLAAQVSNAGGLGIVPGGTPDHPQLAQLSKELSTAREVLGLEDRKLPLPIGVSFLLFHESVSQFESTALPLLQEHLPQAVWLFAHDSEDKAVVPRIINALHDSGMLAIRQVGDVAAARQALKDGADIIVAQGADAGGHQYVSNSGLISLVPEVRSMVDVEFPDRKVVLLAAGGVSDGCGVAAALALGADGVVMGTRFILSEESTAPDFQKKAIAEAVDGGVATSRSTFHDDLQNLKVWPKAYDGRAIISKSYEDHVSGVAIEENIKRLSEAQASGDMSRNLIWAGTGVGLVKETLPAGDIVKEVRETAKRRIRALQLLWEK